ncbi:MAG: hypothetical protein U0228_25845 [Myxococcaceae bacterium]
MLTALTLLTLTTSPVPFFTACEGADLVRRNHDRIEVSRQVNGCTVVRCEGGDRVRRSSETGFVVSRELNACSVVRCEGADRVRRVGGWVVERETNACTVVRCEGWDQVTRTTAGWEISRASGVCMPQPRWTPPPPEPDVVRFGLSYR